MSHPHSEEGKSIVEASPPTQRIQRDDPPGETGAQESKAQSIQPHAQPNLIHTDEKIGAEHIDGIDGEDYSDSESDSPSAIHIHEAPGEHHEEEDVYDDPIVEKQESLTTHGWLRIGLVFVQIAFALPTLLIGNSTTAAVFLVVFGFALAYGSELAVNKLLSLTKEIEEIRYEDHIEQLETEKRQLEDELKRFQRLRQRNKRTAKN
jgi:hypothetical protein